VVFREDLVNRQASLLLSAISPHERPSAPKTCKSVGQDVDNGRREERRIQRKAPSERQIPRPSRLEPIQQRRGVRG